MNRHTDIRIRSIRDPDDELDDIREWQNRPITDRMAGLEAIRRSWQKMNQTHDRVEGLRRVVRVVERA